MQVRVLQTENRQDEFSDSSDEQKCYSTEVSLAQLPVFHVTSPQRIMKCDAGIHEETCTHVVLSGNTIMFQSFGERLVLHGILLPTWVLGWQSIWVPSTMQQ